MDTPEKVFYTVMLGLLALSLLAYLWGVMQTHWPVDDHLNLPRRLWPGPLRFYLVFGPCRLLRLPTGLEEVEIGYRGGGREVIEAALAAYPGLGWRATRDLIALLNHERGVILAKPKVRDFITVDRVARFLELQRWSAWAESAECAPPRRKRVVSTSRRPSRRLPAS